MSKKMTAEVVNTGELKQLEEEAKALSPPPEVEAAINGEPSPKEKEKAAREAGIAKCAQQVRGFLAPTLAGFAPGWNVQPEEIDTLAEAYGAWIWEEWGDIADAPAWFSAVLSTALIFGPRIVSRMPLRPPAQQAPTKESEPPKQQETLSKGNEAGIHTQEQDFNPNVRTE